LNALQNSIIADTTAYVKKQLAEAEAGHDWQHIQRVLNNAKAILAEEHTLEIINDFVVSLACLLHDIADAKFHNGDEEIGPAKALSFLKQFNIEPQIINEVVFIVQHLSFKSEAISLGEKSKAFQIVQDADRLDALGAIGIARTFNYGGYKNRPIFDAEISPKTKQTKAEYKVSNAPTINHFYEKLLLLKDQMNTETGKKLAKKRHDFMLVFLNQFFEECGKPSWG